MKNYISLLQELGKNLPSVERYNSLKFANEIISKLSDREKDVGDACILIGYGGGKDSSWALAFLRYAQLQIFKKFRRTFKLKIITMIHLGTPRSTLEIIDKVYKSLSIDDDPLVEAHQYCYGHIEKFSSDFQIPAKQRELLRQDILLAGHRSNGDGRTTFCFSCNFHMVSSSVSEFCNDLDLIVTGDSSAELNSYYNWIQSILSKTKLPKLSPRSSFAENTNKFLKIGRKFCNDLYHSKAEVNSRTIKDIRCISNPPEFLPIFEFTDYGCAHHWRFLSNFLHFEFTEEAFNFTESDCRHPILMAHLRGLSAERQGRKYRDGIADYLEFAEDLMNKKEFPQNLIDEMLDRYGSDQKIEITRLRAEDFAQSIGITGHNLKAIVYSPVTDGAANLREYLERTAPSYIVHWDDFHRLLLGERLDSDLIKDFVEGRTGLALSHLQVLYKSPLLHKTCGILEILRSGDPHQKRIKYVGGNGEMMEEIITGR